MKKGLLITMIMLLVVSMGTPLFAAGQKDAGDDEITMLFMPGIADPFYYMMEKELRQKVRNLE